MTEEQARALRDALLTQRRCMNRLLTKDREGEYRDATVWVLAQKVIDSIVEPARPPSVE